MSYYIYGWLAGCFFFVAVASLPQTVADLREARQDGTRLDRVKIFASGFGMLIVSIVGFFWMIELMTNSR